MTDPAQPGPAELKALEFLRWRRRARLALFVGIAAVGAILLVIGGVFLRGEDTRTRTGKIEAGKLTPNQACAIIDRAPEYRCPRPEPERSGNPRVQRSAERPNLRNAGGDAQQTPPASQQPGADPAPSPSPSPGPGGGAPGGGSPGNGGPGGGAGGGGGGLLDNLQDGVNDTLDGVQDALDCHITVLGIRVCG